MAQHDHSHLKDESASRIGMAFFLNVSFTIIEFVGGWLTNSTAIMADAVHDLGDSLSIGSAWLLNRLGKKSEREIMARSKEILPKEKQRILRAINLQEAIMKS